VSNIGAQNALRRRVSDTGVEAGTLELTVTSNQQPSCGSAQNDVVLTVNPNPTASAGTPQTLCQDPSGTTVFSLTGSGLNGTPARSAERRAGKAAVSSSGSANSIDTTVS